MLSCTIDLAKKNQRGKSRQRPERAANQCLGWIRAHEGVLRAALHRLVVRVPFARSRHGDKYELVVALGAYEASTPPTRADAHGCVRFDARAPLELRALARLRRVF